MANYDIAVHKLELAVDTVADVERMSREADQVDGPSKSQKITPKQVKDMLLTFDLFDRNNDKSLDAKELGSVFRALGQNPTETQLQKFIKEVDQNENGTLEEDEYLQLLIGHMQSKDEVEREMREAFKVFDKNCDGKIDKQELMAVVRMCGDPLTSTEADGLISKMDTNKDGLIDENEFVTFLCGGFPCKESDNEPTNSTTDKR